MHKNPNILICGDVNCSNLSLLPHLQEILTTHNFTDVGAVAERWGGKNCEPTCETHNGEPTRNDYIFISPALVPKVSTFSVIWDRGLLLDDNFL